MAIQQLTDGQSDGSLVGRAADKLGFYGLTTPIVKATITLGAGTTTTLLKADVAAIAAALSNYGLTTTA